MSSFFNTSEKAEIESLLDDLHDTFKKTVYAFIEEPTYVSFNDSDFHAIYGQTSTSADNSLPILTKYAISARVHYERWNSDDIDNDTGLPTSENIIRLKVAPDDYETIKNASVVEVDGDNYSLISDDQKVGPFTENYNQIYLRRNT